MAVIINKDPSLRKRMGIKRTIAVLSDIPKTSVLAYNDMRDITVTHEHQFVPDWRFVWDEERQYYRVYILVASSENDYRKCNAGYMVFTIRTGIAAAFFVAMFQFIYRNRGYQSR